MHTSDRPISKWLVGILAACCCLSLTTCSPREQKSSNPAANQTDSTVAINPHETPPANGAVGPQTGNSPSSAKKEELPAPAGPSAGQNGASLAVSNAVPPAATTTGTGSAEGSGTVAPSSSSADANKSAPSLGAVWPSALNVRPSAGTTNKPLGRVHCGDIVAITGTEGVWQKVELGSLSGYAHSAYIMKVEPGKGRIPTCEFEHLRVQHNPKAKPAVIPTKPTPNQQFRARLDKKLVPTPAPEARDVVMTTPTPALPTIAVNKPPEAAKPAQPTQPANSPVPSSSQVADHVPSNVKLSMAGLKPPVGFPHTMHTKLAGCKDCHHPVNGEAVNREKNCHTCHARGEGGKSSVRSKTAYHQTCRSCHESKGKGPTDCAECHIGK